MGFIQLRQRQIERNAPSSSAFVCELADAHLHKLAFALMRVDITSSSPHRTHTHTHMPLLTNNKMHEAIETLK